MKGKNMAEVVVSVVPDPSGRTKTYFNIDAIGIEFFDSLGRDALVPGVTYLRHPDPVAKANFINERMAAVGDVTFSLPNPGKLSENIELLIEKAESFTTIVDEANSSSAPATLLKLLCRIPVEYLEHFLIHGQLTFIRGSSE